MLRNFRNFLLQWKTQLLRTPLVVRGARQVGKTYSIEAFGKEEFKNFISINFETSPVYQSCFNELEPRAIINQIELISRQKIVSGEGQTLLFFDEIQQCPKALQSLRYFKEKLPELHVIAAGSLLEFTIRDEDFSFPVGRVQFAHMYPLSFEEYLDASGDTALKQALSSFQPSHAPPLAIHQHLLNRVKEYFIIGGMPASILAFLSSQSHLEVKYAQKALLTGFEADFGKYARQSQHRHLKKIFQEVPRLIGSPIKYSRIDPEIPNPAREMKHAIELLRLAGLVYPVSATSAGDLPLLSGLKENIFKLLFLDIGLVEQAMNIDPQHPGLMTGALAEQFVGQEFLAMSDPILDGRLFFWTRDKGMAEVDYLFSHKGCVYPVEVKAGKTGKLKSLHQFLQEKKAPFGIKISEDPLSWNKDILTVPFYLTAHLERLIEAVSCH